MPGARCDRPHRLRMPAGADILEVLPALRTMLAGTGPLLVPVAPTDPADPYEATATPYLRDIPGVAVGTSGSTGTPKRAVLPTAALHASIEATHARLGGPAPWLLLLPGHHIAGLQVILRSLAAGEEPILAPAGLTTAAAITTLAGALARTPRWYTAVVPAQLPPLLEDPVAAATLRRCAAVLCGGAAVNADLRRRAEAAEIRLIATYGMSETAGGCVYDGTPLDGVTAEVTDGRIRLGGPTIAAGYLDDPARSAAVFTREPGGAAWFTTDDLGALDVYGRLSVHGRRDDVIITGGYKVHPAVVEAALAAILPTGTQVAVAGVPDPRWGHLVAAAVVLPQVHPEDLRQRLAQTLPRYAVPRRIAVVAALPLIGPGKVDRIALSALLAAADP